MDERVLAICVDDEDALPFFMECRAEVHGDGALTDTALLLSDRNDFGCQFALLFGSTKFYLMNFVFQ